MKTATERLIELAERLNPTGAIGDGMVAEFHALAARARHEQARVRSALRALQENDAAEPIADNGATVLDAVRAEADAIFGAPRATCGHGLSGPCPDCISNLFV